MKDSYYVDNQRRKCIDKAPLEILDYGMNLAEYLEDCNDGDYIVSANITAGASLTKSNEEFSQTAVRAFFSGGTVNEVIPLVMVAITINGRTIVRTVYIVIKAVKSG